MGCRFKVPPSSIQGSIQGSTSLSASIIFNLTELNLLYPAPSITAAVLVNTIHHAATLPPAAAPPPDHNMRNLRLLLAAAIERHF